MPCATVRFAPLEMWCAAAKSHAENNPYMPTVLMVGEVRILTETCRPSPDCDGRIWTIEGSSLIELFRLIGLEQPHQRFHLCEHQLELD
jgi:hypothetical protein